MERQSSEARECWKRAKEENTSKVEWADSKGRREGVGKELREII